MDDHAGTDGPESSTSSTDGEAETKRTLATRGTEAVTKAKSKAEDLLSRAEASRPHSAVVDIAFGSYEHDTQVAGGILAGAVAFRIFLFIVPFVFFFVFAFGLYAEVVNKPVAEATEEAGIVGLLATTITNVGDQSFWSRVTLLVISGFALVSGARGLLKSLNAVHIIVWRLPRTRLQHQPRLIGGLILALLMTMVIAQLIDTLREVSFPGWVLGTAGFILIPAAIWLFASLKAFPHPPEADWRALLPGALLVGAGIELLHVFTVVWIIHSFERKSETYGAIGGSLALLLWAYILGRIFAAAPVLNAVMWRRVSALPLPPPEPPLPPPAD